MIKSLFDEDENTKKKDKKATTEVKAEKYNSTQNSLSITENIETQADVNTENIETQADVNTENIETQADVNTENTQVETPDDELESIKEIKTAIVSGSIFSEKNEEASKIKYEPVVKPFEIDKPIGQARIEKSSNEVKQPPVVEEPVRSSRATELEKQLQELEEELRLEKELETQQLNKEFIEKIERENEPEIQKVQPLDESNETNASQVQPLDELGEVETVVIPKEEQTGWKDWEKEDNKRAKKSNSITVQPKEYISESKAETTRKMGMAWSAAIGLFGAVVIMLIVGWFADLLLGTTPWGIVVGIVIGSIIGFVQFVRTTSQIIKPNDFDKVSLKSNMDSATDSIVQETPIEPVENISDKLEEQRENLIVENNAINELEVSVQENVIEAENIDDEPKSITEIEEEI